MSNETSKPAEIDDQTLEDAQGGARIGAAQTQTVGAIRTPTAGAATKAEPTTARPKLIKFPD